MGESERRPARVHGNEALVTAPDANGPRTDRIPCCGGPAAGSAEERLAGLDRAGREAADRARRAEADLVTAQNRLRTEVAASGRDTDRAPLMLVKGGGEPAVDPTGPTVHTDATDTTDTTDATDTADTADTTDTTDTTDTAERADTADPAPVGFAVRAERLMRVAEVEAARAREDAARSAAALVNRARADAEARRHEVEQALLARVDDVEHEAALRHADLDRRERDATERAQSVREAADRVLDDARARAEEIEGDARRRADALLREVDEDVVERRRAAEAELGRLVELQDGVRGDLGRLVQSLSDEFDATGADDDRAPAKPLGPLEPLEVRVPGASWPPGRRPGSTGEGPSAWFHDQTRPQSPIVVPRPPPGSRHLRRTGYGLADGGFHAPPR